MIFHKFNIQSSLEGILTKRKTDTGFIFTTIYPPDVVIEEGDCFLHPDYFKAVGENVTVLQIDSILEERPARGDYKDERPTYRRIQVVRKELPLKELIDQGLARTEKIYDAKTGKPVKKIYLT
jgi:hypothetical protein